jgi:hypothetical protein
MAALPIGGDPDDYAFLRQYGVIGDRHGLDERCFNFSFVGTFMPRSAPVMREFLRGIRLFRQSGRGTGPELRINFVGTSNQANARARGQVTPLAEEEGVRDAVNETAGRVPYIEAISILARSDVILLVGSDEPHYTASKIFPALMAGRPYLSIFHRDSSSHAVLSNAGGGISLAFETAAELETLAPRVAQAIAALVEKPAAIGQSNPASFAAFTGREIARSFAAIFEQVAASPVRERAA